MSKKKKLPDPRNFFNKAYKFPITLWGDVRIPKELETFVKTNNPKTALELGCGLGRHSTFIAEQGVKATGVDFSTVAIEKAKKRLANKEQRPTFLIGDVTNLEIITESFDFSFDIGCFHCLHEVWQQKYVSQIKRLLKPGATHLIWALDSLPFGMKLSPNYIDKLFENSFQLVNSKSSRRRILPAHWYWLVRTK